jgi:hypothetical protein
VKQHLAILLWASSREQPQLCATPFFHAAAAAAMDVDVELHFSSRSVLLLVPGVAATLYAGDERDVTIYQHMQQAAKFGARFYACTDAIAAHSIDRSHLVAELTGFAGAAAFIGRALDPEWATLIF